MIFLHIVYPWRCGSCDHLIQDDNEMLWHQRKFHGIRNLVSSWDKKEIEK